MWTLVRLDMWRHIARSLVYGRLSVDYNIVNRAPSGWRRIVPDSNPALPQGGVRAPWLIFWPVQKIKSSKPAMQFNLCNFTLNLLLKGQWVTYCFIPFLFKLLCLKLRQSFFVYLFLLISMGVTHNTVGSHLVSCSKDLDSLWDGKWN